MLKIGDCERIPWKRRAAMLLADTIYNDVHRFCLHSSPSLWRWTTNDRSMRNFIHHSKWTNEPNRTNEMEFLWMAHRKKTHAHHLCLSIFLLQLRFNYFVKYGLCWNAVHALNPLICAHRSNAIRTNIHFHTSHANATNRPWFIFISLALGTCHFICSIAENLQNVTMAATFFSLSGFNQKQIETYKSIIIKLILPVVVSHAKMSIGQTFLLFVRIGVWFRKCCVCYSGIVWIAWESVRLKMLKGIGC